MRHFWASFKELTRIICILKDNECIKKTLEAIDDSSALSIDEKIEVLMTLFSILKDTSKTSQSLLDDFSFNGYRIVSEIILKLEIGLKDKNNQHAKENIRKLVYHLEDLVYTGFYELRIKSTANRSDMFQVAGFKMPQPRGKGRTVQNVTAFQCLLSIFNKVSCSFIGLILCAFY